jgi:hypothetical protein
MDPTTLRLIQGASGAGDAGIEFVASAQAQIHIRTIQLLSTSQLELRQAIF